MVCDGADRWTYAEPGTGFYRVPVEAGRCTSQLPDLDAGLLDNLVSATVAGGDHIQFEGALRDCDIIRAEYMIPARSKNAGTTIIRTMCIDSARRLILRDRTESWATGSNTRFTRTTSFSSYARGVEIPDEAFRFEVPTGTFLDPGPQIDVGDSVGVSRPQLIRKVEPSWTEEARQAGIAGLVLVSLAVDAEGNPQNLSVARKLGYGLDEKALEAVRQWQFRAGLKDGAPVAVGNLTVAVDFRLP
jgi:TonB family protein